MLTLKTAYTRLNKKDARWVQTDITTTAMKELEALYGEVVVLINIPSLTPLVKSLHLDQVRTHQLWVQAASDITFPAWLESIKEATLPYDETLFSYSVKRAHYVNAFHYNYTIRPVDRVNSVDSGGSNATKTDLYITKKGVTGDVLGKYGLFSINGYYHLADHDKDAVYVYNGNQTIRRCNENDVGVTSFYHIGELQQFPITDEMIHGMGQGIAMKQGVYVTIPDRYLNDDYTYLFVFGGFLHVLDSTYDRVSPNTFRIHTARLNLAERYFSSREHLDYSSLNLTKYDDYKNESVVGIEEVLSDTSIKAYFKLPQTFVVAIKAKHLFSELTPIETPFPGRGLLPTTLYDKELVVGRFGRVIEYHARKEEDLTVICGQLNITDHYTYYGRPWKIQGIIDAKRDPNEPFSNSQFYIRTIGAEV